MTLEELCSKAGVDHSALFYTREWGEEMERFDALGIIEVRETEVVIGHDAPEQDFIMIVRVTHPNLWEEVVGSLKFAEARVRLGKPRSDIPRLINSYEEYVEVFGVKSGTIDNSIQSG